MANKRPIGVFGAGKWGMALALTLAQGGHKVYVHTRSQQKALAWGQSHHIDLFSTPVPWHPHLQLTNDFSLLTKQCQQLFMAVPSYAQGALARQLTGNITAEHIIVLCAKGLDSETGALLSEAWERTLAKKAPVVVLSGPGFADELVQRMPTCVTLASVSEKAMFQVGKSFRVPWFMPAYSRDPIGAQIGGIMKNVLAILCGIAHGLSYRENTRAALVCLGLQEMVRFTEALGGEKETLYGFSGLGDVFLSTTSHQSRNFLFGVALGELGSPEKARKAVPFTVEGIQATHLISQRARELRVLLPMTDGLESILKGYVSPEDGLHYILNQPRRFEKE